MIQPSCWLGLYSLWKIPPHRDLLVKHIPPALQPSLIRIDSPGTLIQPRQGDQTLMLPVPHARAEGVQLTLTTPHVPSQVGRSRNGQRRSQALACLLRKFSARGRAVWGHARNAERRRTMPHCRSAVRAERFSTVGRHARGQTGPSTSPSANSCRPEETSSRLKAVTGKLGKGTILRNRRY
jgi:hypothetical protein